VNDKKGNFVCHVSPGPWEKQFIFWQKGGGFDRNLWNAKAIHDSIRYIEAKLLHNPDTVKGDRVTRIKEGIWSHKWHGHPPPDPE
jgi:hypothetical protein